MRIVKMSKRPSNFVEDCSLKPKQVKHWSLGLVDSMNDPNLIIQETDEIVIIKDKYPKAKIHYLMLPRENITSIHKLNSNHIGLINKFGKLFNALRNENSETNLKAGFHAVPSMQRLHMHVISDDMISPCLKTKIHWNSFTTKFFIPYDDLMKELEEKGSVSKISPELHKNLLSAPLQCHKCDFKAKTMPHLKEHILLHAN